MGICSCVKHGRPSTPRKVWAADLWQAPPQEGTPYLDLYLWKPAQDDAFHKAIGVKQRGAAWAWKNTNEVCIREDLWPRIARPRKPEHAWLKSSDLPLAFSNADQEGIFIHEAWGHALNGFDHYPEDPRGGVLMDITKSGKETPKAARAQALKEFADAYTFVRIIYWTPETDIHGDDAVPLPPASVEERLTRIEDKIDGIAQRQDKRDRMFFGEDGRGGIVADLHGLAAFREAIEKRQRWQRDIVLFVVFPLIILLAGAVVTNFFGS